MHSTRKKIILASSSPRRVALLRSLGITFLVMPSNVDEEGVSAASPNAYTKKLAALKAEGTARMVKNGIIIGADTTVVLGKRILNKPKDKADAMRMLRLLSGRTHKVVTGLCVLNKYTNEKVMAAVSTRIRFKRLSDKVIIDYIKTGEPMDKAGAYAIQGGAAAFVEEIRGDYNNVVGLPVAKLSRILNRMGIAHKQAD